MRVKTNMKAAAAALMAALLAAGAVTSVGTVSANAASEHEPLTMTTRATTDYDEFIEALHEVYPEVNIELVSYAGKNTTSYAFDQLKAGDISDIFVMSYPPEAEMQTENLLDLSGESFISNINLKVLSDLSVEGAVYMLPTSMSLFGSYYNKTLFEKQGWAAPTSLKELEELKPKIEAAGVNFVDCATQYMGGVFSYFFDVNAPEYFTTLDGISWVNDFLNGTATAKGNLEPCVEHFQRLIDLGFLNKSEFENDSKMIEHFWEGNTAFLVANSSLRFTQNEDGTGDEYGLLPYLSEDGSNNIVITNMSFYVGVSKSVEDDPQKKEDAMKVMSFLATPEGQEAISTAANAVSPLKGELVDEESPLYEASKLVDEGKYMSLVYNGWEDYVVDIGTYAYNMVEGTMTGDEFIEAVDELQKKIQSEGSAEILASVEEDLDKEQAAQLVGAAYAKATDADCALISLGDYHGAGYENGNGVNAKIYAAVPMTADTVCTFNPLGWSQTIRLLTLTGAEIKQIAEEGYYKGKDPTPFEYVLVTKDGEELDDDTKYTVAIAAESDEREEQGKVAETEIKGQDAIVDYIKELGTINSETIIWK